MIPTLLPTSAQPVTDDTWLVPTIAAEPGGAFIAVHTMVIAGAEPVLVDTGCSLVRDQWEAQVFSVVEPADVRWIFLSHDDHDHVGNVLHALDRCPNATLVANYAIVSRLAGDLDLPFDRLRFLDPGESLVLPDRTLTVVRPPTFDSPASRALFDQATGVLWAADSFGSLLPGEAYERADVPDDLYAPSFDVLNAWNTPWLEWVDPVRFAAHVDAVAALPVEIAVSCHGPILRGGQIADAFARTVALANRPVPPMPRQSDLEALLAALAVAA
jgi:flavorubredoxin